MATTIILASIGVVVLILILTGLFTVQQQTVAIIERFGKFKRAVNAGLHLRFPLGIDRVVYRVQLRVQQNHIIIETKTRDNVFVHMNVAVHYQVDPGKVKEAYYSLVDPVRQLTSYVEDAIRSSLPKYTLDESFEREDDIAGDVHKQLSEEMAKFGYIIIRTLITAIEPAAGVKDAMNAINAAQRQKMAAQELANADKIRVVTAAEAEADRNRLHGEGIANQRKAIIDGLNSSFGELKSTGLSEKDVMSILLTEQYLDMMGSFAREGTHTILLPSNAMGAEDIRTQLLSAFAANQEKVTKSRAKAAADK
ncbi:MAG: SPFH domain-containing protein [Oscillospiraceae bacterium]|nr:SPFH domain-containing protein [Oscillospiraceae bacterium]